LSFAVLKLGERRWRKGRTRNRTQADCEIISTLRFSQLTKHSKSLVVSNRGVLLSLSSQHFAQQEIMSQLEGGDEIIGGVFGNTGESDVTFRDFFTTGIGRI
jgi:hypothetical protein